VELKVIIYQVWQEIWWVNFYTQINLRNKTVNFHCLSSKSATNHCTWLYLLFTDYR